MFSRHMIHTIKHLSDSNPQYNGSALRIAIVHARWNKVVIDALVAGAIAKLKAHGVKDSNILVQSVPGSYELPLACSKVIAASHLQAGATTADLLGSLSFAGSMSPKTQSRSGTPAPPAVVNKPFDAVIAIGVLIKGSTMHFEYISDCVSHALMKVQLETGVPVIFGVLTALTEEQALERAGLGTVQKGHNHGEDWALAAVEMGSHSRRWAEGKF